MGVLRRGVAVLSAAALVWSQTLVLVPGARAQAPATARGGTIATEELARLGEALRAFRADLDRTGFDPRALGERLGDWRAAWRFVREEIALLPVAGLLRFAAGALASRAGTVCDRALLLAELLRAQGREVRFARARLDGERTQLLASSVRPPALAPDVVPAIADRRLLARLAEAGLPVDVPRVLAAQAARAGALVESVVTDLLAAEALFRRAGIWREPVAATAGPDAAVFADHCWVQMRDGGDWIDLDPTPLVAAPGERAVAPDRTGGDLADLAPRLGLEVRLVRERPEVREETVLRYEIRLARAIETLTLAVQPRGRDGRTLTVVLRHRDRLWSGDAFTPAGTPVSPSPVGDLFGGALGALSEALEGTGGDASPPSAGLLLRVDYRGADRGGWRAERWLVPPGSTEVSRRWIVASELLVTASRLPRAWLLDRTAERFVALAALAAGGADDGRAREGALRVPLRAPVLAALVAWRGRLADALLARAFPGTLAVPDGPLVLARHLRSEAEGRLRVDLDVIRARERVVAPAEDAEAVRAGRLLSLLDDLLEHHLAGRVTESGLRWLRRLADDPGSFRLVTRPEALAEIAAIPPELRRFAEADLAAGARLLVPTAAGDRTFGYWRFAGPHGLAQSVGRHGYGQETAEYTTVEVFVIRASLAVIAGGAACTVAAGLQLIRGQDYGYTDALECFLIQSVTILLTLYLFPTPGVAPGHEMLEGELGKAALGGFVSGLLGGLFGGGGAAPAPAGGAPTGGTASGGDGGPTEWDLGSALDGADLGDEGASTGGAGGAPAPGGPAGPTPASPPPAPGGGGRASAPGPGGLLPNPLRTLGTPGSAPAVGTVAGRGGTGSPSAGARPGRPGAGPAPVLAGVVVARRAVEPVVIARMLVPAKRKKEERDEKGERADGRGGDAARAAGRE